MTLLASPKAVGLFRAAIVMSVPDLKAYTPLDQAEVRGTEIFKTLNVSSLTEARSLPASSLIGGTAYGNMTVDGKVLPTNASPENLAMDVPILMGYTLNDLFAPTPKHTVESWRLEAQQRHGANAGQVLRFYPGLTDTQASESAAREAGDRFLYAPITTWLSRRNATSPVSTDSAMSSLASPLASTGRFIRPSYLTCLIRFTYLPSGRSPESIVPSLNSFQERLKPL